VPGGTIERARSSRGWTRAQLRHVAQLFRYGAQPAAVVYESLGTDVFGAFAPGWLNLGLWSGEGDESEASVAPRRLVEAVCAGLSVGGSVIDVGNGLGIQDQVIAERLVPRMLLAVNISEFQLRAGRSVLAAAGAHPVVADATRLPVATSSADAVISVEAAFHFSSRQAFFAEVRRVLRTGGILSMSDFAVQRQPRGVIEALAGLWTMRFWGLRRSTLATAEDIVVQLRAAGFIRIEVIKRGSEVIDPALRVIRRRFQQMHDRPRLQRWGAQIMVAQWGFMRRRGLIEYVLVRATAPEPSDTCRTSA
jgi:SAM-dependent methyltransferase